MENDILSKLNNIVSKPEFPSSECEVMYFMIETRKLIDRLLVRDEFKTLYFYCNWVAHTFLDKGGIIADFLEKFSEQVRRQQPLIQNPDIYGLISFVDLKNQIENYLVTNTITNWITVPGKWEIFRLFLCNILADCPLEDSSNKLMIKRFQYKLRSDGNVEYEAFDKNGHLHSGTLLT